MCCPSRMSWRFTWLAATLLACGTSGARCPESLVESPSGTRCVCPEGTVATSGDSCAPVDAGVGIGMDAATDGGSDTRVDAQLDASQMVDSSPADPCETCVWGCSDSGVCDPPTQIALGAAHVCALRESGVLACWGWNDFAQLADLSFGIRATPVSIDVGPRVAQLALGRDYSCVRYEDGSVACWGGDFSGQLGTEAPGEGERAAPVTIAGIEPATDLRCGEVHCCVVTNGGAVLCWGGNESGELGSDPIEPARPEPSIVPGVTDAVQVVAGAQHSCARTRDGAVYCWGRNTEGQLGAGSRQPSRPTPRRVVLPTVNNLFAGQFATCAQASDGLWCWGDNEFGQLGDGSFAGQPLPVRSNVLDGPLDQVGLGAGFTCYRRGEEVQCLGRNEDGELGRGSSSTGAEGLAPVMVVCRQLEVGSGASCALTRRGVWCWGANDMGQMGNGSVGGVQPTPSPTSAPR